jgi:uncharacterized protein YndB with AHSA1/START domain
MPRVSRSRVISVERDRVWRLISDPHNLPRWWPKTVRVEDVRGPQGARAHWTSVLQTERGTGVRADFRCTSATSPQRYAWEQQIEGTPFERVLRAAKLEIGLAPEDGGTEVTLTSEESLRGISRLGSSMMRGAARNRLDEALASIERVLVG